MHLFSESFYFDCKHWGERRRSRTEFCYTSVLFVYTFLYTEIKSRVSVVFTALQLQFINTKSTSRTRCNSFILSRQTKNSSCKYTCTTWCNAPLNFFPVRAPLSSLHAFLATSTDEECWRKVLLMHLTAVCCCVLVSLLHNMHILSTGSFPLSARRLEPEVMFILLDRQVLKSFSVNVSWLYCPSVSLSTSY